MEKEGTAVVACGAVNVGVGAVGAEYCLEIWANSVRSVMRPKSWSTDFFLLCPPTSSFWSSMMAPTPPTLTLRLWLSA